MYRHPEDDIIVLSRTVPKAQSIAALILCVESLTEAGFANTGISYGAKPGAEIEVAAQEAAIPKPALLAATDKLGVRTQCGQWWLPG